jgi:hypothetical protein
MTDLREENAFTDPEKSDHADEPGMTVVIKVV